MTIPTHPNREDYLEPAEYVTVHARRRPTRMGESSLGELGATGTEENGWRRDRRVDISLR